MNATGTLRRRDAATDEALKLWVVLNRAHEAIGRVARADITRHGLSEGEFAVLDALYHKGPLLIGALRRKVLVSSGGTTYLVDRLVQRGLVERLECPEDARARYAALTPEGEVLMDRIFPPHAARIAEAVAGLDGADRRRAIELLKRLGHAAAKRG